MTNPGGTVRWSAGDPVLLRFVRNRPADVIMPVTIVQDTDEYIALYTAVGTPIKVQAARDGTRLTRQTPFIEREGLRGGLADGTWTTNHVLMLHGPGRMSAIWLFWRDLDWTFTGVLRQPPGAAQADASGVRHGGLPDRCRDQSWLHLGLEGRGRVGNGARPWTGQSRSADRGARRR